MMQKIIYTAFAIALIAVIINEATSYVLPSDELNAEDSLPSYGHHQRDYKLFPHHYDCQLYYEEHRLRRKLRQCPDGENFDFLLLECVDEERARCYNDFEGHEGKAGVSSGSKAKPFKCPYSWGKYPDPEDCTAFYLCLNQKPHHKKCERHERFDKHDKECRRKDKVDCETDGSSGEDSKEDEFKCPHRYGKFPYSKDCSQYYACQNYRHQLKKCQKNELYDEKKYQCHKKNSVKCGSRWNPYDKHTTTTTTTTTARPITTTTKQPVTPTKIATKPTDAPFTASRQPEGSTVTTDFEDHSKISTESPVSESLATASEEPQTPDEPITTESSEASREPTATQGPDVTGTGPDGTATTKFNPKSFKCPQQQGLFEHPDDCSAYLSCDEGVWEIQYCQPGLLFDIKSRVCFDENEVDCGNRLGGRGLSTPEIQTGEPGTQTEEPVSDTEEPGTEEPVTQTEEPATETLEPSPETEEPETEEPSPETEEPETEEPSTQTKEPETEEPSTQTEEPETEEPSTQTEEPSTQTEEPETEEPTTLAPYKCPRKKGNFLDPEDCSKFYACRKDEATHEKCPKRMLFHTKYGTCFAENSVDCEGRPIHSDGDTTDDTKGEETLQPITDDLSAKDTTVDEFVTEGTTNGDVGITEDDTCLPNDRTCEEDAYGTILRCKKPSGHFKHPKDLQLFIHCDNFRIFIKKCPDDTIFSPFSKVCVRPY